MAEIEKLDGFSLALKERAFTIDGRTFVLKELDGDGRDCYMNTVQSRMKNLPNGTQVVKDFKGLQASLLARTLFEILPDGEKLMDSKTIQSFPTSTQKQLFDMSQQLSGLDPVAEDTEGND